MQRGTSIDYLASFIDKLSQEMTESDDPETMEEGAYARGTLEFYSNTGKDTLLHELVHAMNGLTKNGIGDPPGNRRDEGMGYTYQHGVNSYAMAWGGFEKLLKQRPCDREHLAKNWKDWWKKFYTTGWSTGTYGWWRTDFVADDIDFLNTQKYTGVNFTCDAIARAFNRMLGNAGCCFRLTCEEISTSERYLPAGVKITKGLRE